MRARYTRSSSFAAAASRRAPWLAWIASITVVIMAVAPALGTLHRALVRHVVCEHGDLIEPDGVDERLREAAPLAARSNERSLRTDLGPLIHAHNHCLVGTLARTNATFGSFPRIVADFTRIFAAPSVDRTVSYVRSILHSAPKTSPPESVATTSIVAAA